MSRTKARAWSAGVWGLAPDAPSPSGWWPHILLTETDPDIAEFTLVGSRDPRTVPGADTLLNDYLVGVPLQQETIDSEVTVQMEDPFQVFVYYIGGQVASLKNTALQGLYRFNWDAGIRALYQHEKDPRIGLMGKAVVYPNTHQLPMETPEGTFLSGPLEDRTIVVAGLRAVLAYTQATDQHEHP